MSGDRDENRRIMALVFILLAAALAFFLVTMIWIVGPARAEMSMPSGMAFCSLYARESVRIDLMHTIPVKPTEVTDEYIVDLAVQVFKQCVSILPTLLPLPEEHRNLATWVNDMQYMVRQRAGTVPATDDAWRAQCERTYRTWDEATGTVVRSGSPERVRCPCGDGVTCD